MRADMTAPQERPRSGILSEGFKASDSDYDWLVYGSYFFGDGLELAWLWADEYCSESRPS